MNQAGRDALRAAALAGVWQITDRLRDMADGRCALGVLEDARPDPSLRAADVFDLNARADCTVCGERYPTEEYLVFHYNDWHRLDFLGISEKMPVSDAP